LGLQGIEPGVVGDGVFCAGLLFGQGELRSLSLCDFASGPAAAGLGSAFPGGGTSLDEDEKVTLADQLVMVIVLE
jgi:hypothetical protein